MATLVSDIITDAFRESNLVAISATPTDLEIAEALRILNRLVALTYHTDAGEKFTDFPIGSDNIVRPSGWPYYENQPTNDWFAPLNSRLMLNVDSPQNIYLSPLPQDGSVFSYIDVANNIDTNPITFYGNGRLIEGATSVVKNTAGDTAIYFYRADTGNWSKLSPLLINDDFPFPPDFDDVFIIGLAIRLNPRNDISLAPESMAAYKKALSAFTARYTQIIQHGSELGLIITPGVRRFRGFWNYQTADSTFLGGNPFGPSGWA